ncbi:MAG: 3-isopropylmalate dehydratase small subunit [Frankia sp.]
MVASAAVLDVDDVDTDQIIPAERLKKVTDTGYADDLFADWRRDPGFVLNDPRYRAAAVLVAGRNFGCGSSREHAVWALRDFGFRAVISAKIADIFRGNAAGAGFVPVELPEPVVAAIMAAVRGDSTALVEVDVSRRRVRMAAAGVDEPLALPVSVCRRIELGLDEIDMTLEREDQIRAHEGDRPVWMPALPVA